MGARYLDPQVGCVHRQRITECRRCVTERVEWLAWQRRTDQLIEIVDRLGWPAADEPSTLLDPAMAGEGVARG